MERQHGRRRQSGRVGIDAQQGTDILELRSHAWNDGHS